MNASYLTAGKVVATITPSASLEELVSQLQKYNIGALVVTGDGKTIDGIVSERDIVRAMPGQITSFTQLKVRDLMSTQVITCKGETSVSELMETMTKNRIRHMPVVDDFGKLISIVSIGDVMKNYADEVTSDRKALQEYIVAG
jgi:CBS domain-containing protein